MNTGRRTELKRVKPEASVVRTLRVSYASDAALLAGLAEGQPSAATAVWDRFAPLVRGLLRQTFGPGVDVDDLTQDVFLTVYRRANEIRDSLRSFVVGVCVRVARGELRRRRLRRWLTLAGDDGVPDIESPAVDLVAREALRRLYAILDRLDADSRLAFSLRYAQGLEGAEIAEALGCSLATAKRRLAKARERVLYHARQDTALLEVVERAELDPLGEAGEA